MRYALFIGVALFLLFLGFWLWQTFCELPSLSKNEVMIPTSNVDQVMVRLTAEIPKYLRRNNVGKSGRQVLVHVWSDSSANIQPITVAIRAANPVITFVDAEAIQDNSYQVITPTAQISTTIIFNMIYTGLVLADASNTPIIVGIIKDKEFLPMLLGTVEIETIGAASRRDLVDRVGKEIFPWFLLGIFGAFATMVSDWFQRRRKIEDLRQEIATDSPEKVEHVWAQYIALRTGLITIQDSFIEEKYAQFKEGQVWEKLLKLDLTEARKILTDAPHVDRIHKLEEIVKKLSGEKEDIKEALNDILNSHSDGIRFLIAALNCDKTCDIAEELLIGKGKEAVNLLIDALGSEIHEKVSGVLIKIGEPAIDKLGETANQSRLNLNRRLDVIEILTQLENQQKIAPYLKQALTDPSPEIRRSAKRTLRIWDIWEEKLEPSYRPDLPLARWLQELKFGRAQLPFETDFAEEESAELRSGILVSRLEPEGIVIIDLDRITTERWSFLFAGSGCGKTTWRRETKEKLENQDKQAPSLLIAECIDWTRWIKMPRPPATEQLFDYFLQAAVKSLWEYFCKNTESPNLRLRHVLPLNQQMLLKGNLVHFFGEDGLYFQLQRFLDDRHTGFSVEEVVQRQKEGRISEAQDDLQFVANLYTLKVVDSLGKRVSPQNLLDQFEESLKSLGIQDVYILIDNVPGKSAQELLKSLLVAGTLLQKRKRKWYLKFFLDLKLESLVDEYAYLLPPNVKVSIDWDERRLHEILKRRIQSAFGPQVLDLGALAEEKLRDKIDRELVAAAQGSPRELIRLARALLEQRASEWAKSGEYRDKLLITLDDWDAVRKEYDQKRMLTRGAELV